MAPASPSQTATISESARPSHTPNSERSWRHWPSLHSSNHKSPVTSSEGRPGFWGGLRLKGRINGHSADDNGSPTNRERRKSITDIFADLGSPKKQRERSWSIGRLHTKSGSASSSKNDSRIERLIQPKRRRSISDLFGSLRAHSSNHVSPQVQTPSILPEFSGRGDDLTVNTGHANKEDTGGKPSVVETATVVRVPPTLRVRFANSDQCEDRLENRSERTIIIRDIKQPEAERRICSASSGTSNSPTLVAEDRQDVNLQPGKETDRPRTPDSYLQMLIAAYESPASGSSMSHEHNSPSPSPGKYQAVQPLDFLADKYTPPMDDRDCSDSGPLTAELSPLACMDPITKKRVGLKRQDRATRRPVVSWIDSEEVVIRTETRGKTLAPNDDRVELTVDLGDSALKSQEILQELGGGFEESETGFDSFESLIPDNNGMEPAWEVGDIYLYLQLTLQDRNERFSSLQGEFYCFEPRRSSTDTTKLARNVGDINLYFRRIFQERNEKFKELEGRFDCFEPEMPSTETTDPIWNVGDIHSNFKRRFQERNERYGRLIDRIYIGRKIRMTVARMTRNYHSNRSSEEDHGLPSTSQANLLQDMIPGGDGADPQLGPVCQFGMDSRDAIDSVNRGSQILREIQNDAEMHTGSIKNIPSPGLKPKCEAALDKTLADTIKLREIYEKIVEQAENDNTRASQSVKHQEKSDVDKISELKSCNSNMVWLEYLKKFTVNSKFAIASSADHIITSGKQSDESKWTVNAAEDDILLSMIRGSSSNSERNPAPGALEEEAETESWTRRKSRKVAGKTVSYDDAEFYRSSEEWKEETLDVFRSLCEPRPSCLAQPPEESIKKQNQDFETFPSTYIIDHVLEDSRALRTFGGYASFSTFQAGEASMTSKMSNSARRRVVSTAAVQVQFPVTRNVVPQIETFDSRSEAIAALCEYKLSQLSNFVVYDPAKRMFYAQNGEYTPPSSAVLIEKRLELVWLPLQPDSLSKAAEADNREDKQSGSSTQENKMEQPLVTEDSKETASVCRLFTAHNSLVGESNFCTSDSAIGNEGASKVQSSIMIADLVDNLPGDSANQKRENEWTLSDEEYVVQMDPATALEHLGSDYANSVCSTPKLVKGTLLYPRILLSGEDDWYDSEDSFNLRSTPTWTQLGREFRARHPEILSRSKCSSFEDNSEVSSYDTEFESSSPGCSESGNWSRQVKDPYCPIRNDPLRLNESFETGERDLGRNPSYDNLTGIAEHVEDITSDVNGNTLWRKLEESGVLATTTPNNTDNAEHVADGDRYYELGIHAKCDHLQCRTGSGESSSEPGSIASWRSWVEAELVQSALYQPLPWLPLRNSEDSTGNKSTYSSQDTQSLSREPKILSQPKVLDELKQDGPANSTSGSGPTRHRSSSVKSFAAGFRFTAFSEYMPEERGHPVEPSLDLSGSEHMLGEHKPPVESSLGSNDSERALPIILQPEPHISACEKVLDYDTVPDTPLTELSGLSNSQVDFGGDLAGKHKAIAENSNLLEAVNTGPVQAESAVTPESLNIRLVGRAARQSQLAKTSKVGALIDVYKAFGVMPQTLKPALHRTQTSPVVDRQSSGQAGGPLVQIVTPPSMIEGPCGLVRVRTAGPSNNSQLARRVPTPVSVSGDVDTESDSAFGEELGRAEKHDDIPRGK